MDQGTWLCPTPADRARLLEMERSLGRARAMLYAALGVGVLICAPRLGWWTLLLFAITVGSYRVIQPRLTTSRRPENLVAFQVAVAQTCLLVAVALTGGPTSPILVLTFLPLVTLPARFGTRGVVAGVVLSIAGIGVAAIGLHPERFAQSYELTVFVITALIGLGAFGDLLQRTEMHLRSAAVLDPLTGLLNRQTLEGRFDELREQARLMGVPVSVILCDIDGFKAVNDTHGHARGDAALVDIAYTLRSNTRMFELIYRIGGDELMVVLPGMAAPEGLALAEVLRTAVERCRPAGLDVTLSLGVASAAGSEFAFLDLYEAADRSLYAAKAAGRNRVGFDGAALAPAPA